MAVGPVPLVLVGTAALAGCAAGETGPVVTETAPSRVAAARTEPAPAGFAMHCRRAAGDVMVSALCPELLPRGGFEAPRAYGDPPCTYLVNLEPRGAETRPGSVFHLLFGGACRRWDLSTADGRWPRRIALAPGADLRLIGTRGLHPGGPTPPNRVRLRVVRNARVGAAPALVLRNPPYPTGGIHGGHITVVWNAKQAGYAVSGHPAGADERLTGPARRRLTGRATATLLAVARSMRPASR